MISNYDIIHQIKKIMKSAEEKGEVSPYVLSDDEKNIVDTESNQVLASVEEFAQSMRVKEHCDFEVLYYNHVGLQIVYQCQECGTVIFASEDEFYDPRLCCPTCGGYDCHFEYWTKAEIESDPEKQKAIELYKKWTEEEIAAEKRRQARGGLYDWQLFVKKFYGKKYYFSAELEKLAGLTLRLTKGVKDGMGYRHTKQVRIPLSPYSFYIAYIFPYSKKCTVKSLRKYFPWQKKPAENTDM